MHVACLQAAPSQCWACLIGANCCAGKLLVRYYGEHSSSWVAVKQLVLWDESNEAQKVEALKVWGKKASRSFATLVLCRATVLDALSRSLVKQPVLID